MHHTGKEKAKHIRIVVKNDYIKRNLVHKGAYDPIYIYIYINTFCTLSFLIYLSEFLFHEIVMIYYIKDLTFNPYTKILNYFKKNSTGTNSNIKKISSTKTYPNTYIWYDIVVLIL